MDAHRFCPSSNLIREQQKRDEKYNIRRKCAAAVAGAHTKAYFTENTSQWQRQPYHISHILLFLLLLLRAEWYMCGFQLCSIFDNSTNKIDSFAVHSFGMAVVPSILLSMATTEKMHPRTQSDSMYAKNLFIIIFSGSPFNEQIVFLLLSSLSNSLLSLASLGLTPNFRLEWKKIVSSLSESRFN